MKKIKWGIIGVGDVTEVKSGPAFNLIENSEIISVMRRNLSKAADYAKRHSIPSYTNNAQDIFANPDINAVYIATPPSSHCEYTLEAAKAKKHVYVEKPMALNFNQCQQMVTECERNGVKLFVAYYRRELDYFKKIKEIIDRGDIGEVKYVDIKYFTAPKEDDYNSEDLPWRVIPEIAGSGYFYDLASHQFDMLDFLLGPIKSASGHNTNQLKLYEAEDVVTSSLLFESNVIGTGAWCFSMEKRKDLDRTEIIGSDGKITFSFFTNHPILLELNGEEEKIEISYPKHVQQQLITTVVNDILGVGKCISTGKSGMRTNKILEQILF